MKNQSLSSIIFSVSVITLLSFSACKKEKQQSIDDNPKSQSSMATMSSSSSSAVYTTGYRFGWTVLGLGSLCEYCPFWLCKGKWVPTPGPSRNEVSSAYIEDGHLIFEVLVEDYKIDDVEAYINNGTIEFTPPSNEIQYMEIPNELVSGLNLSYDKIYPGVYAAERISGTDKIKITFE